MRASSRGVGRTGGPSAVALIEWAHFLFTNDGKVFFLVRHSRVLTRQIDVIIINNNDAPGIEKTVFSRVPANAVWIQPHLSIPRTPDTIYDQPAPQNWTQRGGLREVNAGDWSEWGKE